MQGNEKNANDRASHPTAFSMDFIRTEIINPITNYIKQNYKDEARDIALYAKDHDTALIAPNGKVTNLSPVLWLAVRLQSFKKWFGDWENDPANASKIVNPLLRYWKRMGTIQLLLAIQSR